jgi:hypothetical protein
MTRPTERNAAYGVIALCIILALAMFWPSGAPQTAPAYAQQPIIAARPAWTPRPEVRRDGLHALAVEATPEQAGGTAPAEPPSQVVYSSDGSATLAGVDTSWQAPPEATSLPVSVVPISAELYKSLPVAGEPPVGGGRPMTHGRGK